MTVFQQSCSCPSIDSQYMVSYPAYEESPRLKEKFFNKKDRSNGSNYLSAEQWKSTETLFNQGKSYSPSKQWQCLNFLYKK